MLSVFYSELRAHSEAREKAIVEGKISELGLTCLGHQKLPREKKHTDTTVDTYIRDISNK